MIARYEVNSSANLITEQQRIKYFLQAKVPSLVNYAAVDNAMKTLKVKTTSSKAANRMMNLQADLESVLDSFNPTDQAFEHEHAHQLRRGG
jgi:thiamine phosphate synthase YjbQ (UPF0047 family)